MFCDLGTPGKNKDWSVYDDLTAKLVAKGMGPAPVLVTPAMFVPMGRFL